MKSKVAATINKALLNEMEFEDLTYNKEEMFLQNDKVDSFSFSKTEINYLKLHIKNTKLFLHMVVSR
eukprot:15208362-Ditylum_brightwellii.AAC.1